MVLINGVKMSCESCLRGHRASSCSHTRRHLVPVRRKGRPSSQCDVCKSKRVVGNFHGKCQCNATASTASGRSSSGGDSASPVAAEEDCQPFNNIFGKESVLVIDAGRSKHSLEALMNPCRCKTTGICTCCKTDLLGKDRQAQQETITTKDSDNCCDGQDCCSDNLAQPSCQAGKEVGLKEGCCSSKTTAALSIPNLECQPILAESSQVQDTQTPPCQCGSNCACPGCFQSSHVRDHKPEQPEDCPDKCLTCTACAFGLTRPSGIEAVDDWIEKDKETQGSKQRVPTPSNNKKAKLDRELPRQMPAPPLPPFANASSFYSSHFLDPERRNYFANQLRDSSGTEQLVQYVSYNEEEAESEEYGARLKGESDEEWQIRNGFYYLTPEAIKIFDSTRKFKELREYSGERKQIITVCFHTKVLSNPLNRPANRGARRATCFKCTICFTC